MCIIIRNKIKKVVFQKEPFGNVSTRYIYFHVKPTLTMGNELEAIVYKTDFLGNSLMKHTVPDEETMRKVRT